MAAPGNFLGPVRLDELITLLNQNFEGVSTEHLQVDSGRIIGFIIWSGFLGMEPKQRNELITERIRRPLGSRAVNLGIILPYAPGEIKGAD